MSVSALSDVPSAPKRELYTRGLTSARTAATALGRLERGLRFDLVGRLAQTSTAYCNEPTPRLHRALPDRDRHAGFGGGTGRCRCLDVGEGISRHATSQVRRQTLTAGRRYRAALRCRLDRP